MALFRTDNETLRANDTTGPYYSPVLNLGKTYQIDVYAHYLSGIPKRYGSGDLLHNYPQCDPYASKGSSKVKLCFRQSPRAIAPCL